MNDADEKKRILEHVANAADREADQHHETCHLKKFYKDVSANARRLAAGDGGPAQVATPAYRSNYETIFGKRVEAGQA